jgi:ArsR family transcriptional regulator
LEDLLNIFHMLSDKTRLRILLLLLDHELCVCEIFGTLDMTQPRVSRQLALLRQARLIKDRRAGKWIYYRLDDSVDTRYLRHILSLLPEWLQNDAEYLDDQAKLNEVSAWKENCDCALPGGGNVDE